MATHINKQGLLKPCHATKKPCQFIISTPDTPTLETYPTYQKYKEAQKENNVPPRTTLFFADKEFQVSLLAGALHLAWQREYKKLNGETPRIKTTNDKKWIKEQGTDQVDIANTNYEKLPADWQAENKAAAEFIVKEFVEKEVDIHLSDTKSANEIGEKIHQEWLRRNSWAKEGPLGVKFIHLTKEEQDKDLQQYYIAKTLFF